jgi:hypothetical protein
MHVTKKTLLFGDIAAAAGFLPDGTGKTVLPANQQCAQDLADASVRILGGMWGPGDERVDLTISGAGPVWAYLVIAHALHGRVVRLTYAAPNAEIVVFSHGL